MWNMNDEYERLKIEDLEKLSNTENRGKLLRIVEHAFSRLDPEYLLQDYARDILYKGAEYGNVFVIGFGKASLKMYRGIRKQTSGISRYSGIIIPSGEHIDGEYPELEILRGNHPIPANDTLTSSKKIMESLGDLHEGDLVLVLISGGGSALFEIPEENFTMETIAETAKCLMNSGADIQELNAVRQAMSSVKGGKLARKLFPAEVHGLIISDVPGDDPSVIASGPLTKPAHDTDYLGRVLEKYRQYCRLPEKDEILKSAVKIEPRFFSRITTKLILKNSDFVNLFTDLLNGMGETVVSLPDPVTGDVVETAEWFADRMRKQYRISDGPVWIVGGGETTAKVIGNGTGGRNCELSLRVALNMEKDEKFLFASLGTDGIDGVSPAMGGITDSTLMSRISRDEILESLANSDSYTLLNKYNSAIITGYTGTNVSDIFILYYGGKAEE